MRLNLKFGLDRLKETSTWRSIIVLFTVVGATLTDTQSEHLIMIGASLFAAIGTFFPDKVVNDGEVKDVNRL